LADRTKHVLLVVRAEEEDQFLAQEEDHARLLGQMINIHTVRGLTVEPVVLVPVHLKKKAVELT
jgi:hypothetical protein